MKASDILNFTKKALDFIWHGESLLSYACFILFCAITLPILWNGFMFCLGFAGIADITAILTPSMVHSKNTEEYYHNWFELRGYDAKLWEFPKGFNPGDAMVVKKVYSPFDINVGDVIVFFPKPGVQIIHRVTKVSYLKDSCVYTTKGDNNPYVMSFEKDITYEQVKGKAWLRLPFIGVPKALLYYGARAIGL